MSFLGSLVSDVLPIAGEILGGIYGGPLGAELGSMLGRSISNTITGSSSDVVLDSNLPSQAQAIFNSNYVQAFEGAAA